MNIPHSHDLPTPKLAAAFSNTSATYKFYWLISIIEEVEQGSATIQKQHLFARIIANAWYTVNYFHVSFGKQDLIQSAVQSIRQNENLTVDIRKSALSEIFGAPDDVKLRSSMTLFSRVKNPHPVFSQILEKYFQGAEDGFTLELLEQHQA